MDIVATRLEYQHWKDECPLRKARLAKGLSQGLLGALCGVSGYTICKYENGASNPEPRIAAKMALALGEPNLKKMLKAWRRSIPR